MNPNVTLSSFLYAQRNGDFEGAREFAEDLAEWLARGGYEPTWPSWWSRAGLYAWLDAH